jgi:hypothetical protein
MLANVAVHSVAVKTRSGFRRDRGTVGTGPMTSGRLQDPSTRPLRLGNLRFFEPNSSLPQGAMYLHMPPAGGLSGFPSRHACAKHVAQKKSNTPPDSVFVNVRTLQEWRVLVEMRINRKVEARHGCAAGGRPPHVPHCVYAEAVHFTVRGYVIDPFPILSFGDDPPA